jgi:ATP-dependent Lhr-like helicase
MPESKVEAALLRLEADGVVLRGQFTTKKEQGPRTKGQETGIHSPARLDLGPCSLALEEWCDRRLLARIHRLTINRLRREIEAVSAADFMRFLLRWQHVHSGTQLHGRDGIRQVIGMLQGVELPAPAWERDVLPARINLYNPADLDQLCLAGEIAWGRLRLTPPSTDDEAAPALQRRRRVAPTRAAPLALMLRESMSELLEPQDSGVDVREGLSENACQVLDHLSRHGAAFLADIARATRLLPTQTEDALWELVARGLVTGDGIAGLRTLLLPEVKRRTRPRRLRGIRGGARRSIPIGRWALLRTGDPRSGPDERDAAVELFARQLLRRYGVVLRDVLAREARAPSWRVLLGIYRRLEARGEIRGGRFVAGFVGEQFALPEAVDALRAVRRAKKEEEVVVVRAADPLNLVGILTPGARVSPFSNQVIAYRDGIPVEIGELGAVISRLQIKAQ